MAETDPSARVSQGEPGAPAEGELDAAELALSRLRDMARARGMRPGAPGGRRRHPRRNATAGASRRDPQPLGSEFARLVSDRGWQDELKVGRVLGDWVGIVGPGVADHSEPLRFTEGVLTIRAESTTWAAQLTMMRSTLEGRLAEELGVGVVSEVRIVGPTAPSWSRGPRRVAGPGPRDTYG